MASPVTLNYDSFRVKSILKCESYFRVKTQFRVKLRVVLAGFQSLFAQTKKYYIQLKKNLQKLSLSHPKAIFLKTFGDMALWRN